MDQRSRRDVLKAMTQAGAALGAIGTMIPSRLAALETPQCRTYRGQRLLGWETVPGDASCSAPGVPLPSPDDIRTISPPGKTYSEIQANILHRNIMAHNVTFKRIVQNTALNFVHIFAHQFRLPFIPSTTNSSLNGETIEGGIFVWDGANSRMDYGCAWQWVINPWASAFQEIRIWNGSQWKAVDALTPDTRWHTLKLVFDYHQQATALIIDGRHSPSQFSVTPKPPTWGPEIAARVQIETISLHVCAGGTGVLHRVQIRNWAWIWAPSAGCV